MSSLQSKKEKSKLTKKQIEELDFLCTILYAYKRIKGTPPKQALEEVEVSRNVFKI